MTRIIITRHGETEWNILGLVQGCLDSALTPVGIVQAEKLASRLHGEKIGAIYSSSLGRAMATAQVLGSVFKVDVRACPEFGEISFGSWEGQAWHLLRQTEPENFAAWEKNPHSYHFPGGECMADVLLRAKPKLLQLCDLHPDETICVVSHGITVKVLITDLLGYPLADWEKTPWQANTALNIFEVTGGKFVDVVVGDSTHLEDKEHE